jgi:hypothetical protein
VIRTSFRISWKTPLLTGASDADRLRYWQLAADAALRRKDWELSRGLNKDGKPLPKVSAKTRKRRRSAMTPSGKGDPRAPYLMPGRALSRTRSLLAAKPSADGVWIYWRFDPWTGGDWGRILRYHSMRGRAYDVIGLSPEGVAAVRREAEAKYKQGIQSHPPAPKTRPLPIGRPGRTSLDWVDLAVDDARSDEIKRAFAEGRASGFLSQEEWRKYWREGRTTGTLRSPARTSASVRAGSSNRLLAHTWEVQPPRQTSLVQRLKVLFAKVLRFGTGR